LQRTGIESPPRFSLTQPGYRVPWHPSATAKARIDAAADRIIDAVAEQLSEEDGKLFEEDEAEEVGRLGGS
jgi:hypothetical protein